MTVPENAGFVRVPDVVVIDTCVLMSNVLRRMLLQLATQACFRPAWSAVIGEEWQRNAARIWNVSAVSMYDQWQAMQQAFPQADQGDIDHFKQGLHYSDRKDWHVIAAARAAQANDASISVAVLTRNIRDFNRSELRRLGLGLFDPDQFLVHCLRQYPSRLAALLDQLPGQTQADEKEPEALAPILKRERLFRLNRLYPAPVTPPPISSIQKVKLPL